LTKLALQFMYGFTITYTQELRNNTDFQKFIQYKTLDNHHFYFGYNAFKKFEKDKIFDENTQYIIGIDGVILNLSVLKTNYIKSNYFELIIHLFKKFGIAFVSELKGEFDGFIFDKESEKLHIFNNKTATKQVFYAQFENQFISAPSFKPIVILKQQHNHENVLNEDAVYNMLTFGGMIENQTLIKDVYKLNAGEYLVFHKGKQQVAKYFDYNSINISITDKNKAIKQFNEVFMHALTLEYDKDKAYGYQHMATLSGGLDSRMTVMLADKLNYKNSTFCFSQSNYADEIIAKKIATKLDLDFQFFPLDGGDYLTNLEEMVGINNGLQFYHGSAHYHFALKQLELANFGLIHTGQIGDGILGGFVSKGKASNYLSKTISNRFLDKLNNRSDLFSSYRDEEVFKLYQRVFNLTNFGSYVVAQHNTYLVSPFMDDDVIRVALSIHPDLKYNQNIYLEWVNKYHKEVTAFKWERTGLKPTAKWKTEFARYTQKRTNPKIEAFYAAFFERNIENIQENQSLFIDLNLAYNEGSLTERAIVLTILESIRKFNLKV